MIFRILCITLLFFSLSCQSSKYSGPTAPEEALQGFVLDENFKIELFAAEPLVQDPVEMVVDERGNIYVVEMPDYPFQPEGPEGKGRIKILLDRDNDGQIDDAVIFADGIKDATSVQPWKGGILVTAAPYIYFMKDTNGDFVADEKEVVFSGFFQENQEAQITNLRFNIDNWVYAANHGRSADVLFSGDSTKTPFKMRGADFRFRLDKGLYEPETAAAQFGQALNDWGHRFITQNTLHIQQAVIPWRYLNRHSNLPSKKGVKNISDHDLLMYQITEAPYWRVERSRRRQERYDEQNLGRIEHVDSHFTGASGGTHYGGDLFPAEYHGNIFTGAVMGNLVHRDVLTLPSDEVTYVARRGEKEHQSEFLVSNDQWFRPAHFTVGPDGALYVVDMYRQHIETPLSIPEDLKEDMDFMRGSDQGRIYRIVPKGSSVKLDVKKLQSDHTTEDYVQWLTHPNQWYRLHGQRLLLERQDQMVIPEVRDIFENHEDERARLHALYVLEGMNVLTPEVIRQALTDVHPRVREHALMLAESCAVCFSEVAATAEDNDLRLVFQSALSLANLKSPKSLPVLADMLDRHVQNEWMRIAILSSEIGSSVPFLRHLATIDFFKKEDASRTGWLEDFSYVTGNSGKNDRITSVLSVIQGLSKPFIVSGCRGLSRGLKASEIEIDDNILNTMDSLEELDEKAVVEKIELLFNYFSSASPDL